MHGPIMVILVMLCHHFVVRVHCQILLQKYTQVSIEENEPAHFVKEKGIREREREMMMNTSAIRHIYILILFL